MNRLNAHAAVLVALLLTSPTLAGPATAPAQADSEPVELRVFRILAMGGALGHGGYAEHAAVDDATRKELRGLIDRHRERVDREVAQLRGRPALPPYDALVERAGALRQEFDEKTMATWLGAHPQAAQAIQQQASITEAAWTTLAHNRQKLLDAWSAAGGQPKKLAEARKLVNDAYASLVKLNEDAQRRQQEAQKLPLARRQAVEDAVMYEGQLKMLEEGQGVHRGLRELIEGPRQREAFDSILLSSVVAGEAAGEVDDGDD